MITKVFLYIIRFIINPVEATGKITEDKTALWIGFWWVVIFNLLYSVTVLIFYLLGHTPVATPWLPIPPEKWYLVQTFTTIPVGLAGFLTYSGTVYILIRAFRGISNFEAIFATQSFTLFIPCIIFMWIPETFIAPFLLLKGLDTLPWPAWVENMRIFIIPFTWIFIMSTLALSRISQMQWWKSLIVVIISLIPCGMIMAVFIR